MKKFNCTIFFPDGRQMETIVHARDAYEAKQLASRQFNVRENDVAFVREVE